MTIPFKLNLDKTDYLLIALSLIRALDILTFPAIAIAAIFWVRKYRVPLLEKEVSLDFHAKKVLQVLLFAASGAMLGMSSFMGSSALCQLVQINNIKVMKMVVLQTILPIPLQILLVIGYTMIYEFVFRRCLYSEWRKHEILLSIIASGVVTMLFYDITEWNGVLILGAFAAAIYEVTRSVAVTTLFHSFFWFSQIAMATYESQLPARQLILLGVAVLTVAVVLWFVGLTLSANFAETYQTIIVQLHSKPGHPYVFRFVFNNCMLLLFMCDLLPY